VGHHEGRQEVARLREEPAQGRQHYWVYATAVPNKHQGKVVGYTSVRRKPSRKKIEELSAVYKEWKAAEGST